MTFHGTSPHSHLTFRLAFTTISHTDSAAIKLRPAQISCIEATLRLSGYIYTHTNIRCCQDNTYGAHSARTFVLSYDIRQVIDAVECCLVCTVHIGGAKLGRLLVVIYIPMYIVVKSLQILKFVRYIYMEIPWLIIRLNQMIG